MPPGDHVVSLSVPDDCSVQTDPQQVTVIAGGLIRDSVTVTFSATCAPNVQITAPTTGSIPKDKYEVWSCIGNNRFYDYDVRFLGNLEPNGVLRAYLAPGRYHIWMFVHPNCVPQVNAFTVEYTVVAGHTLDVELPVVCSP